MQTFGRIVYVFLLLISYCFLEYVRKMAMLLKISSIFKACWMLLKIYITEYISKTLKMKYGISYHVTLCKSFSTATFKGYR